MVGHNFDGVPFNIDQPQTVNPSGSTLQVKINAPQKFAHLEVAITSEKLTPEELESVGLSPNFDLAYPGDLEEGLSGLGFPVGDEVIGKTEVLFDISQYTILLSILGPGTHVFEIKVTDQASTPNIMTKNLTIITQ